MKREMRPGNMVYPLPAALVSCIDKNGNTNLITVAWTGTICSDPAMLYISVRPERFSHHMLMETGEFVLNLTTEKMAGAVDLCGVKSGRDCDKWKLSGLTPEKARKVKAPLVKESPVSIECKVTEVKKLGSHNMFLAEVLCVDAEEKLFDKKDGLALEKAGLMAYSHGKYLHIGEELGTFGYSVKKNAAKENKAKDAGCPVSGKCGSCLYAGIPYTEQLQKKQRKMESLLGSFARVDTILGMADPYHYRNKVHHVFGHTKAGDIISGCYEQNSHRIVNVDDCLIEDEKCQQIIRTIRKLCRSFKIKTYNEDTGYGLLRHVLVRRGFKSGEIMVVLILSSQVLPGKNNFVKALLSEHPEITTIVLNVNDKDTSMVLGDFEKTLYGPGTIKDELCGKTFRISPASFYQVNPVQTEVLYGEAIKLSGLTGKETVIDAYCGIGTIGICASGKAGKVIGIEQNPAAVRDAKLNAKENGIRNISFVTADATQWIKDYDGKADVIFMDPPRTGSTAEFIRAAAGLDPERIVYISCGPDTLARDLKEFGKQGYHPSVIRPVDMFPLTDHVENVVLLLKDHKMIDTKDTCDGKSEIDK